MHQIANKLPLISRSTATDACVSHVHKYYVTVLLSMRISIINMMQYTIAGFLLLPLHTI